MRDVLAAFLLASLAFSVGCGDDDSSGPVQSPVRNELVFQRSDSSTVVFRPNTYTWCGAWEEGEVPVQALHVVVGWDPGDVGTPQSGWQLKAVVEDIVVGEAYEFPASFVWNEPEGVDLFVLDPPNELSSQEEESRGELVFQAFECIAGGAVAFSIDAVIGSEFGEADSLTVTGTFRAPVGSHSYDRVDR